MSRNEVDHILTTLVETVSAHATAQLGITLTLPSGIVTGKIISPETWLRGVQGLLQPDGEETILGGYFAKLAEEVDEENAEWAAASEVIKSLPNEYQAPARQARAPLVYVHLKDARLSAGNQLIPTNGTFWRGRLSEVIGFNIGILA
jgi:hypothetical protein